jgi:aspartyl-tRNA(Asn)/glutamyl-tRNA(Gln) amidotransferase subunit A
MNEALLYYQTITDIADSIRKGEISCRELVEKCLSRTESLDGKLNAFKLVCKERAMAQARSADLALKAGKDSGPLHGIPYAAKDLFDVNDLPTTASSRLLIYGKPFQENVVRRAGYSFQQVTDWHRRFPDLSWVTDA